MRTVVAVDIEPSSTVSTKTGSAGNSKLRHRSAILNWFLAIVLFSLLIFGIDFAIRWLFTTEQFAIAKVRIEGEIKYTDNSTLQNTVTEQVLKNFFTLDINKVRDALESLPWIAESHIRRVWPLTLVIWLREREALARWGERSLVSPEGVVFTPDPKTISSRLIYLNGPEGSANQVIDMLRWVKERFAAQNLNIAKLILSERHAWYIILSNGLHLSVGTQDSTKRIERFLKYLPRLPQPQALEQIDLRYAYGFAARWRATVVP